ncbi:MULTISPECIES: ribose 5-phosphate isomerase B [Helcococcus]|uniref:Ribose 5-phosphate isomerase B n=1 Tax=Helcococcus bovis TaxID=3153252 RepID=A0ABW9F4P8_9FIRM
MKIAIAGDHVGTILKKDIVPFLESLGHKVKDFGPFSEERTHYPIYAQKVANAVVSGEFDKGIVICGTGVGISIAANKVKGIRCVCCSEPYSAKLSREHNDTNMLAFGSRVVGLELAKMIVTEWLNAEFEGGRHSTRVEMISEIEENNQDLEQDLHNAKINC